MEEEIELKIILQQENIMQVKDWIAQFNIIKHNLTHLDNTYYDTATLFFASHKMGLRIREKQNQFELTLKTENGIKDNVHLRQEYHLPIKNKFPEFNQLITYFNLQSQFDNEIEKNLIAIFTTNFVREKWLIQYNQDQIEIALDQGKIASGRKEAPICELELELKKGSIDTLLEWANQIPLSANMQFSNVSKAQRGYELYNQK